MNDQYFYIICDLFENIRKNHTANREGSFKHDKSIVHFTLTNFKYL